MTHAEALSGPRPAGMPESPCQGELALLGRYPDYVAVNGAIVPRMIEVFRCATCETQITRDETGVRNVYRVWFDGVGVSE